MTRGAAFVWTVAMLAGERLDHFDGVLVRVHTLSEGVRGDFGSISIALTLLWALFTTMLLISWYVIRRMVSNMYVFCKARCSGRRGTTP